MVNAPQMTGDQVTATVVAALVALGAGFIYFNAVAQSLVNEDRRGTSRLVASAIAVLSLAIIAFQSDRLRFLLFTGPYPTGHGAPPAAGYVVSVPNMFWAGIPLLAHGLIILFRNYLQDYRLRKSGYTTWRPDAVDWFAGVALAMFGGAVLWQWHPAYLPAAVGWTIALALGAVVSIVMLRWSARE